MIDITKEVKAIVDRASDEDSRAVVVYSPNTTCGILIQEKC